MTLRASCRPFVLRVSLLAAIAVAALTGCGPVTYINEVTRRATADVEAARTARADRFAPYYFTLAVEYLRKAREEAAHADFQAANRLGKKASQAARQAIEQSLQKRDGPDAHGGGEKP